MKIVQIAVGVMQANCFLVYQNDSKEGFLVDPGAQPDRITAHIEHYKIEKITHILLTHGHFDHIGALAEIKDRTGALVCIHKNDADMLTSNETNLASSAGVSVKPCEADILLEGGDVIKAAGFDVEVLHTPGHSGGSVCYLTENVMFSGDTLFYRFCGRTDFPGSDAAEYHNTLNVVLKSIGKDYHVYTGHGKKTTLFDEFKHNTFFE